MAGLNFDDAMPRMISARTHGIIDYIHAATNFLVGAMFWKRNKRAATGAFILGGSVLANALMTDYEYGVFRLYDFKKHGMLDYGVAAASAAMPALFDMADTSQAKFFYAQGAVETLTAGVSDYDDDSGARRTGEWRGIDRAA